MLAAEAKPFRVVRHSFNGNGELTERAVLAGQIESRGAAIAFIEREGERHPQFERDEDRDVWHITDTNGYRHSLLIEGA